jgi:hypothetical protein
MNLYQNANYEPPASVNPGILPFTMRGCYTDNPNNRALPIQLVDWTGMTVQKCLEAAGGYRFAAVEYYGKHGHRLKRRPTNERPHAKANATMETYSALQLCQAPGATRPVQDGRPSCVVAPTIFSSMRIPSGRILHDPSWPTPSSS